MPSLLRRFSLRRPRSKKDNNDTTDAAVDSSKKNNEDNSSEANEICRRPLSKRERQVQKREILKPGQKVNLSFAGCGFLGLYHLGVAQCLVTHGKRFLQENVEFFAGASAGSLVAAILSVDSTKIDKGIEVAYELARMVHRKKLGVLTPGVSLLDPLKETLHSLIPDEGYEVASKKLHISITTHRRPRRNKLISTFHDNNDLVQCLLASSYVPHLTGTEPVDFRGSKYIDGGMTDNLPILDNGLRTVTVSPFSGTQDICPEDGSSLNMHWNIKKQDFRVSIRNIKRGKHALFPPNNLSNYIERGKRDAERFLRFMGLYEENNTELVD
ncbi:DgyrCDS2709 [Dimorphilus gyrociliatus]|uniref:DgyrCDS2709 n=1 Tax=Dimorphilus gyrociliatus TaxID=2664684 RepID=A0A7I8VB96_9ANNE|nr:DgyrCDS2709 [Dimorphilus gyrociliatus]